MSLLYISQQLTIYCGLFLFISGIIGNVMNILIFSSVRTYRTTPSSFFFLVGSINSIFYLLFHLTLRILSGGYGIDLVSRSKIFCKIRAFFLSSQMLISVSCSCLAAIDQFFVTSRNVSLRRCSQIKWAHRIIFIMIIIWCFHGIFYVLYYDISPINHMCVDTNAIHQRYTAINIFIILCIIPVVLLTVFGYLSYRSIHRIRILVEENADRQLTTMTLIQAILVIISITPFGVLNLYGTITAEVIKGIDQQMKEYFILTIVTLISYLNFVGTFYMFLISSSRFRRTVKDRICWWRRPNQIVPIPQLNL